MIKIKQLSINYIADFPVINNLSLQINKGETVALIGANGAGKTSLLQSLVGIVDIFSGEIEIDGINLYKKTVSQIRQIVGLIFQNPDDQLFMPNIFDDIAFGPQNFGKTVEEVNEIVSEVLATLNITHLKRRSSLTLSGGEKRMVAIATVLAMAPKVMLFDEPTAFLDPKGRQVLIECLKTLPQTKLIATHDLDFAIEACKRSIIIKKGGVAADGNPKQLLYDEELMSYCGLVALKG